MSSEAQFVDAGLAETLLGDDEDFGPTAEPAPAPQRAAIIALVGMAFEAKIAAGPGVLVFSRNSQRELALAVNDAARLGCRGIISFGVAGGLISGLRPGDWVIASAIVGSDTTRATDAAWSSRLHATIEGASYASIIGMDTPVAEPATKRELHRTTGAIAVDMESHVVAEIAAAHGLAFAALRVIVDPAERVIPSAALRGMGGGGRADGAAVLRDLAARPAQLSRLVRVSLDALIARSEMIRVRRLLGPHFGLTDLGLQMGLQELANADLVQPDLAPSDLAPSGLVGSDVVPYRSPA